MGSEGTCCFDKFLYAEANFICNSYSFTVLTLLFSHSFCSAIGCTVARFGILLVGEMMGYSDVCTVAAAYQQSTRELNAK